MIWFDNFGSHKTIMMDEVIGELGVQIACLPPNMTVVLQVLDLVVNGPLKSYTWNLRWARIEECFKSFIKLYTDKLAKNIHKLTFSNYTAQQQDGTNTLRLLKRQADLQQLHSTAAGRYQYSTPSQTSSWPSATHWEMLVISWMIRLLLVLRWLPMAATEKARGASLLCGLALLVHIFIVRSKFNWITKMLTGYFGDW